MVTKCRLVWYALKSLVRQCPCGEALATVPLQVSSGKQALVLLPPLVSLAARSGEARLGNNLVYGGPQSEFQEAVVTSKGRP